MNAVRKPAFRASKIKVCRVKTCGKTFTPTRFGQVVCSPRCAHEYSVALAGRQVRREKLADRRVTRARLEELKTVPQLIQETQRAFNAYIRERDEGRPCISCGVENPPVTRGGQWDAGHFRTVGAAGHLRFSEDNAHRQCKHCNGGRGDWKFSARKVVSTEYRNRLVDRIGLARVEALENDNTTVKWSREALRALREHYRQKLKRLKASRREAA